MTDAASDVANPGLIRPPFVYLAAIAVGVGLQLMVPLPFVPRAFNVAAGAGLVIIAAVLFISAVGRFRAAGTAVPANKPTTAIVRAGPYRFSRNPIYLGFSLFHLGIAIWVNSLWLLATLALAIVVIQCIVIRREEQYLERKFGVQYLEYKAAVRRWL